ncbi:hypothetical protein R52603_04552 [Paraburkholderia saeva]|nr:hypothetical protein R52603_04552 [Paraburkholderia saeva]CAG4922613.1 hypothetical protein R70241_05076 [Paraburkholderia saeva]
MVIKPTTSESWSAAVNEYESETSKTSPYKFENISLRPVAQRSVWYAR